MLLRWAPPLGHTRGALHHLPLPPLIPSTLAATAALVEQRLQEADIQLTMGGEPTLVPFLPQGLEWSVAADGPTKLGYARALAAELRQRAWPGSTLLYCPGKRYDGEVNPRWALRLITGEDGRPLVAWPQDQPPLSAAVATVDPSAPAMATGLAAGAPRPERNSPATGTTQASTTSASTLGASTIGAGSAGAPDAWPLPAASRIEALLEELAQALDLPLEPLQLRDPLDPERQVWAIPLSHDPDHGWQTLRWALEPEQAELLPAVGPAGLRLPLQHFPADGLRQVLTLERDGNSWGAFLPPLAREPLERLLALIARGSAGCCQPELSGVLPLDIEGHWQVLGLTADPGVLEVNLPVCPTWQVYADWIALLEVAGAQVGLRSWKAQGDRQLGTGGGNHLLLGGPSLEANPFFARPAWLVGVLRYWQHHPCLAYLFSSGSIGPASQAPRPDEGSASLLDLELAHRVLEQLPAGDQRVAIGETLRHLHADRSGNTHRSEISLDKFWNPAWTGGCQGLLEFRALETLPQHHWTACVALLWRALVVRLVEPAHRPRQLRHWGDTLHDRALLPSQLWADLEEVLADLARDGLPLDPEPFRAIWDWRFPLLLDWSDGEAGLQIRQALEPWPLLCDTPVEGGSTSRFVDSSLRRFELLVEGPLRQRCQLLLQGRGLPLPVDSTAPVAVRFRQEALFPCLHPCLPVDVPLELELRCRRSGETLQRWQLHQESKGFEPAPLAALSGSLHKEAADLRGATPGSCTLDLRL